MDGASVEHVREAAARARALRRLLGVRAFARLRRPRRRPQRSVLSTASAASPACPSSTWRARCGIRARRSPTASTLDDRSASDRARSSCSPGRGTRRRCRTRCRTRPLCMAAQRGMEVVVLRPEGFDLHPDVMAEARRLAAAAGGSVRVSARPRASPAGRAHRLREVVGLASRPTATPRPRARLRAGLRDWCVGPELARPGRRSALHALPAGAPQRGRHRRGARRPGVGRDRPGREPPARANRAAREPIRGARASEAVRANATRVPEELQR